MNANARVQGQGSSRNFKLAAVAIALLGVAYLAPIGESPVVPEATAKSVIEPAPAEAWQYFPDLLVNQGTEFEESYIEQF